MKPIKLPPELDVKGFQAPGGKGYALIDLRYFPVSVMVWKNDPFEELMHPYYAWRLKASQLAHERGALHVVIKDLSEWGVPKPTVRQIIGEYAQRDNEEHFGWRFLIVSNPIMRGAVTAIAWIKGENSAYSFHKNIAASIAAARTMYDQRGLEFVDGLHEDTYVFPEEDLEKALRRR
jgi:hypothetical protein